VNQSVTQGLLAYTYGAQGIIKSIRGYKQDFGKNEFPLSTASELVGKLDDSGLNTDSGFNNVATPS
jgi:hypothetical protein